MTFTIPILIRELPEPAGRLTTYVVRPLFHAEPVRQSHKLSRALNKLAQELHELLSELGRQPRHDELASWTFSPPLDERTIELRLEIGRREQNVSLLLAGYAALDRKLYIAAPFPGLPFEVWPGQLLEERATAVLTRQIRELEKQGDFDSTVLTETGRCRLTTLELTLEPAALAAAPKPPGRALLFGEMGPKDGERELRRVGRSLQSLYPDDLDHAVGCERPVEELARLLAGADRRPILVVGPRQVGKTAILHEVTRRLCARKAERCAGGRTIWHISSMRLISGMSVLGEWENRILAILDHARARDLVLYFDDLMGLFTAGVSSASDLNVAQVLKPALEKRSVRVIAEITPEAWRILRERDRRFADLFHVLPVSEPSEAETLRVLVSVARHLEAQHACEFAVEVVPTVFDLCRRFGGDAVFPGKAASFLRRLAIKFRGQAVGAENARKQFQEQSGLRMDFLDHACRLDRDAILAGLRGGVVGQDHALQAFADVLVKFKARLHDPRRPLGTFLLLGPTGVGKTQAAKALARYLFSHEDRLLRFDMNEYVNPAAAPRLTGTAREPEGLLTSAIRRQPFSVVLFDEIEKAAPEVFDLLLGVLDEGRLTDALGRVADFTGALIVLTSNLGARKARSRLGFGAAGGGEDDEMYLGAAEKFFRPEFVNRLDRVIPFRPLAPAELERIAQRLIADVMAREGMRRSHCMLHLPPAAFARLVELGHHPQLGARALKRIIEREVIQPLAQRLAAAPPAAPTVVSLEVQAGEFEVRHTELHPAPRRATWAEAAAARSFPSEHRNWMHQVRASIRKFLDRIERELAAITPAGRFEISDLQPEQEHYLACREQCLNVQRLAQALERSSVTPLPEVTRAKISRARPSKVGGRQYQSGLDRRRDAIALEVEVADLEAADQAEQPHESPALEFLCEAAALEAMAAQPAEDRPTGLIFQVLSDSDRATATGLAARYMAGLAGLWGEGSQYYSRGHSCPGLWCRGINLWRLLPASGDSILVCRPDGSWGVLRTECQSADAEPDLGKLLEGDGPRSHASGVAAGATFGRAIHLLNARNDLTDFRSGQVHASRDPNANMRLFLLSSLPLPSELQF